FLPAIAGNWIYDDHPLIRENPYAHSFAWWPRWFVTDFWDVSEETVLFGSRIVYWRPAITASYALDWQLGGGSPVMFHITNTLAQAAVAGLAFVVLRRWIGAMLPALLAALLFAVHPTKAESVAWISGRTDIYCMVAILVATEGVARRLSGKRGGLSMEVFGTLAAYMCKEQAIVLPAFVGIEAWVAAGRPAIDRQVVKRIVWVALPQTVLAVAYFGLRGVFLPIKAASLEGGIGPSDHLQAILETIGRFVSLSFAPHDLSIQQGLVRYSSGHSLHSPLYMAIGAIALVAMIAVAIVARKRWSFVTIGIAFYLITLAPTSNIIYTNMQTLVSERFLYLPVLGLTLVVGSLLACTTSRWAYAAAIAAIFATGAQSASRSADYRDERQFWARELALHPESPMAQGFAIGESMREKRYEAALAQTLQLSKSDAGYQDAFAAVQMADILAALIPDHDRASLEKVDAFCQELLEKKAPAATIAVRNVTFSIPTQNRLFSFKLEKVRLRITALRAEIKSRLGDDAGAVALADAELAKCPRCRTAIMMTALAHARASDYEAAREALALAPRDVDDELLASIHTMVEQAEAAHRDGVNVSGPAKLRARAAELSALELFGRAYDVLAPYKAEIVHAPKVVVGFAELAFRAGDAQTAREVLATIESASEVEAHLAEWERKMGWVQ
ncbi:MAG: hypothetical protein HOV81_32210, partial [Kofleriaceae bacterium]|nr:hypothetical protein [Kofleriaceae bacterium]